VVAAVEATSWRAAQARVEAATGVECLVTTLR
jgi:hypothetical protein